MSYQQIAQYRGSMYGTPTYQGIEYDFEVPDNMVVASPGGFSSTQHHFTKGFYGHGGSRNDLYAGQGYAYPSGTLASAYEYGQSGGWHMGEYPQPPDQVYTANNSTPTVKDSFEFIPMPDGTTKIVDGKNEAPGGDSSPSTLPLKDDKKDKYKVNVNGLVVFVLFIFAYLALAFFSSAGQDAVEKYHGGKVQWREYVFYGIVCVAIVIFIAFLADVNVVQFEKL